MISDYIYAIADRQLASVSPLPELCAADGPADFHFEFGRFPELRGRTVRRCGWGDATFLTISRGDAGWVFAFPGVATFLAEPSGRIVCEVAPGAADHTVRHLLIDQVIPLLLAGAHAETVLHASAVGFETERGARAVLFIGDSGAGKSTTATILTQLGTTLLADDFALITFRDGRCWVPTAGVGVRLWPGTSEIVDAKVRRLPVADWHDKERYLLSTATASGPVELGAVVWLEARKAASDAVNLRSVGFARASALLLDQSYRPDTATAAANAYTLQRIAEIVEAVPVVAASLPHSLAAMTASCAQLLDALRAIVTERAVAT